MKHFLLILCSIIATTVNAQSYIGRQYPEYNFTTITGETITSTQTKGKVVLLSFWFKDCSPCRKEMEWLNELYDSLKTNPDFQFISIARETKEVLPRYVSFFHLKYPVVSLVDLNKYSFAAGFPTNIIIDKQGKVAYYHAGGSADRAISKKEVLDGLLPKIKALL